jgi:hypothetical protein
MVAGASYHHMATHVWLINYDNGDIYFPACMFVVNQVDQLIKIMIWVSLWSKLWFECRCVVEPWAAMSVFPWTSLFKVLLIHSYHACIHHALSEKNNTSRIFSPLGCMQVGLFHRLCRAHCSLIIASQSRCKACIQVPQSAINKWYVLQDRSRTHSVVARL